MEYGQREDALRVSREYLTEAIGLVQRDEKGLRDRGEALIRATLGLLGNVYGQEAPTQDQLIEAFQKVCEHCECVESGGLDCCDCYRDFTEGEE